VAHANSGRIVEARQHVEEALRIDPASTTARKLQEALR
jgi:hypothetical protein